MGLFSDGFKELKKASEPLYKAPKSIQECRVKMGMTQEKLAETLITKNLERQCGYGAGGQGIAY